MMSSAVRVASPCRLGRRSHLEHSKVSHAPRRLAGVEGAGYPRILWTTSPGRQGVERWAGSSW
jgi:hypothetical protein